FFRSDLDREFAQLKSAFMPMADEARRVTIFIAGATGRLARGCQIRLDKRRSREGPECYRRSGTRPVLRSMIGLAGRRGSSTAGWGLKIRNLGHTMPCPAVGGRGLGEYQWRR